MKKTFSKVLSCLLVAIMMFSMLPANTYATETTPTEGTVLLEFTSSDKTYKNAVFGNGYPLLLVQGSSANNTTVYWDKGTIGEKDAEDVAIITDKDLRDYVICGGSHNKEISTDIHITMLGGSVRYIVGGGFTDFTPDPANPADSRKATADGSSVVTGNTVLDLKGGTAYMVYCSGHGTKNCGKGNINTDGESNVTGNVEANISGTFTCSSMLGGSGSLCGTVSENAILNLYGGTVGNVYINDMGGQGYVKGTRIVNVQGNPVVKNNCRIELSKLTDECINIVGELTGNNGDIRICNDNLGIVRKPSGFIYIKASQESYANPEKFKLVARDGSDYGNSEVLEKVGANIVRTINWPIITTESIPDAIIGQPYSYTLSASGKNPMNWTITSGELPEGLTLNAATGEISGTANETNYGTSITFTVTNGCDMGVDESGQKETLNVKRFTMEVTGPKYTIYINTNGSDIPSSEKTSQAGYYVRIKAGQKSGYKFVNWISSNGGLFDDEFSPNTLFAMPANATTVTAIWAVNITQKYALNVNTNGGSIESSSNEYAADEQISINAGTREGYTFSKWESSNGGSFENANTSSTKFTMPANVTTVTAVWTLNGNNNTKYMLNINTNGGSISSSSAEYAASEQIAINAGTREGYTFANWTSSNGGTFENANAVATTFIMPANATTISAIWSSNINNNQTSTTSSSSTSNAGVGIVINGQVENIGLKIETNNNLTIKVDENKFNEVINKSNNNSSVIFDIDSNKSSVSAELSVKNIENMANRNMILEVKKDNVSYSVPAASIDTEAILSQLGITNVNNASIKVNISTSDLNTLSVLKSLVKNENATLIKKPIEFSVNAVYNNQTVEVKKFDKYVSREFEISKEEALKITTAVVIEKDNSLRHVPTYVYSMNGKWFAKVNSKTNSTYALISKQAELPDVAGKWYEKTANEMASRQIISATESFNGDKDLTRDEFAALLVRAFGLPKSSSELQFNDVEEFSIYYKEIATAYEYGIITGKSESVFDPQANITREEAMTMIKRAANVADYFGNEENDLEFADYDKVSEWARAAVDFNIANGLVKGYNGKINPSDNITKAEGVEIILRLLQQAELIDIR